MAYNGESFLLSVNGANFNSMFVGLDELDQRQTPDLYADEIANQLRQKLAREVPEATMAIVGAPPIRGVGRTGGFKFVVEDRGDLG